MLDSREYEIEFPDGSMDYVTANTIAENLFTQIDDEGRFLLMMDEIQDHKKDGSAVGIDDAFVTNSQGLQRRRITTKGWKLLVSWKDGSTSWVPLKDLKESNPVEVAEYAVANKIAEEPAFAWWVRPVLRKRYRIIKKVKTCYWDRTHKFGIALPHSVEEAIRMDIKSCTTYW